MPRDKPGTQRKVFMLPTELVERITAYQTQMGIPSEVEAVRRLLDDSLKFRDDWRSIVERVVTRIEQEKDSTGLPLPGRLHDAAKEIVVGHPLVASITFEKKSVEFRLLTGENLHIYDSGTVLGEDAHQNKLHYPGF